MTNSRPATTREVRDDSTEEPHDVPESSATALIDAVDETDDPKSTSDGDSETSERRRRLDVWWIIAFGVLPGVLLVLALVAGYFRWTTSSLASDDVARAESVQVAKDTTVALLSYRPDTVENQLDAASGLLTGDFKKAYAELTSRTVIPGAKQQHITADATVPSAASVSADPQKAVVMVFVNQTTTIGAGAPSNSASVVRVTLEKQGGRWLVSEFDPI